MSSILLLLAYFVMLRLVQCQELDYECNEPESCANEGLFIHIDFESLVCSGLASCYASVFYLRCVENEGCEVQCIAEEACAEARILDSYIHSSYGMKTARCDAFKACLNAVLSLSGPEEFQLECKGYQACASDETSSGSFYSVFPTWPWDDVHSIEGLLCEGVQSCYSGHFIVQFARKLTCDGEAVCAESTFNIYSPAEEFEYKCQGDAACSGANANFFIHYDTAQQQNAETFATNIKSITCEGNEACLDAHFRILNYDEEETLVIDELRCSGWEACKNLRLEVVRGVAKIKKCICDDPSPYSCLCASGLEICEEIEGEWNTAGTASFPCD